MDLLHVGLCLPVAQGRQDDRVDREAHAQPDGHLDEPIDQASDVVLVMPAAAAA